MAIYLYCEYEGEFEKYVPWQFKFYDVKMFYCPKHKGTLNHHRGVLALGQKRVFEYH